MAVILRQTTAIDVLIGPFLDGADGLTQDSGVSPSVFLSKNGQALAAKHDATTPTHDSAGYYNCELDTGDTDTVGDLVLIFNGDTGNLAVRHSFQVVEESVYDSLFASNATRKVDADLLDGDTGAALGLKEFANLLNTTGQLQATGIASNAITADKIATDAIGSAELSSGAVTEIAQATAALDTGVRQLINRFDTGVQETIDRTLAKTDTGIDHDITEALSVDTYAEPGQGTPASTTTLAAKINYLYKAWRNRHTQTATQYSLYNDDATTVDQKATVSDNGTTFDKTEVESGP